MNEKNLLIPISTALSLRNALVQIKGLLKSHARVGLTGLMLLLCSVNANAVIEIEITKGGANAIPIAIAKFGWNGNSGLPEDIAEIVSSDLLRSGLFSPLPRSELVANPVSGEVPNYELWRESGVDYLVIGGVRANGNGYKVDFQLLDPIRQKVLSGLEFTITNQSLRNAAHQIADEIFEEIIGIQGAFNTDIAYVSVAPIDGKKQYRLELSDADGRAPQAMLKSTRPIMSPSWSPDGSQIAYVSFEDRRKSAIYVQNRRTSKRRILVSKEGINGAPSWSPDGTQIAVVLSFAGNADIYVVDVSTSALRQITRSDAIDTEPAWMDNETLVFTSARSGGPQLYEISTTGGSAKRMTFEGRYNASPAVSPDGRQIAFVHREGGAYLIAVMDRNSGGFRVLTDGDLDESPSFAPNGQMVLYATSSGGRKTLGAVSLDGDFAQSLTLDAGSVRDPAWSPFRTKAR